MHHKIKIFDLSSFQSKFSEYYPNNKQPNDHLLEWLIGFSEGEGSFILAKRGDLAFVITQSTTDVKSFNYIKDTLGFGKVIKQSIKQNTHRFVIQDIKHLYLIGLLFFYKFQPSFILYFSNINLYYNNLNSTHNPNTNPNSNLNSTPNPNLNPLEDKDKMFIRPLVIYTDPINQKESIIKDNLNKSGVYRWTNKQNGKTYIGSSINLTNRLKQYYGKRLTSLKNVSLIYQAILKYGHINFTLEILEYCNKQESIKREQYYLDLLKPEYNILAIAGSPLGRKLSLETRIKLSKSKLGTNHSEETKALMSKA